MLVAAFQIQIRRPSQFFALFQYREMGGAGIEPHIHGVGEFVVLFAVFRAQQFAFIQREPCFNAFFFNALCHFFQQLGGIGVQLAGFFVRKEGHRRAPETLAGNHPIRAAFNHRLQAGAPPSGEEFGVIHRF